MRKIYLHVPRIDQRLMHPIGCMSSNIPLSIITFVMPLLAFRKSQEAILHMLILLRRQRRSISEGGIIWCRDWIHSLWIHKCYQKGVKISLNITLGYYIIHVCTGMFYTEVCWHVTEAFHFLVALSRTRKASTQTEQALFTYPKRGQKNQIEMEKSAFKRVHWLKCAKSALSDIITVKKNTKVNRRGWRCKYKHTRFSNIRKGSSE